MGVFHAVDAQTGEPRWTFEAEAEIISSANVAQNRLLFGSYDQFLYCLSAEDGSLVWRLETEGYVHGTPAIINGAVVISGCDGYLRLINIADGVEQQRIALGDYVAASPAILNNRRMQERLGIRCCVQDWKARKFFGGMNTRNGISHSTLLRLWQRI